MRSRIRSHSRRFCSLASPTLPSESGDGRLELALAEIDRTDAWSRSLIMLVSPTGTGYVNYVATACGAVHDARRHCHRDAAVLETTVPALARQDRPGQGENRLLWLKILERVRLMAPDERPRVVLFGESLGAHTSQRHAIWGTLGPKALGIDRALSIGTPRAAPGGTR